MHNTESHKQKLQLNKEGMDPFAIEIVRKLQNAGFTSYFVGGCVRDLLAGIKPKDFDIATNAEPEQIKRIIRGSHIIGRRFRLVLLRRYQHQYEIATFRKEAPMQIVDSESEIEAEILKKITLEEEGLAGAESDNFKTDPENGIVGDNYFGTAEEDAKRRDFTINALFYDPIRAELIDYVDGLKDIKQAQMKIIGQPELRIKEDPIRSLRAIRLAHKLNFQIQPELKQAIQKEAKSLENSIMPRRREEYLKLLRLDDPAPAFFELYDLNILEVILPSLHQVMSDPKGQTLLHEYLKRTHDFCKNHQLVFELMIPFVLALAHYWEKEPNREQKLEAFLREEIGLFKSEIAIIFKIIELKDLLMNHQAFQKKGYRRQTNFMNQENLDIAFELAQFEKVLNSEQLSFWKNQFKPL